MKNLDRLLRRTHLYLGFALLPWFMMYGFSSLLISHPGWFSSDDAQNWTVIEEREYHPQLDESADLRDSAEAILADLGMKGPFWANQPSNERLVLQRFSFWNSTRLTFDLAKGRVTVEGQPQSWDKVIKRMHFRGGFIQPTWADFFWAIVVDLVCFAILTWIATGVYMWWKLKRLRRWGAVAIAAGAVSFILFMIGL
ncbi:MAG: hypothetical protein GC154_15110 [bacterium]|nr:hypothetical protein [bacterium]